MKNIVELSNETHKNLKVREGATLEAIKDQHIINIQLQEACIAATNFPVFLMPVPDTDRWSLSAIMSYETGKNLFVKGDKWLSTYQPNALITYPLFVMPIAGQKGGFTVGIEEQGSAFSENEGTPLFESDGKASIYLSRVIKILEASGQNEMHSIEFAKTLNELSLIVPANIQLKYENEQARNLTGLYTIDEKALNDLDTKQFEMLREKNYIASIYGILISKFQLKNLLDKNNEVDGNKKLLEVNMTTEQGDPTTTEKEQQN